MKQYTCPMHPEILESKQGTCPLCHMRLVVKKESNKDASWKAYTPLFVIISLLLLVTVALTYNDIVGGDFLIRKTLSYFMIGFFLTFSGFKLIDLPGFAQGYSTYDLLAQKIYQYGYVYPFIELGFGLGMILFPTSTLLLIAEVLVMTISGIGVLQKLIKKETFTCACLGTVLKVPLTHITLVEDFGMALLALIMLIV